MIIWFSCVLFYLFLCESRFLQFSYICAFCYQQGNSVRYSFCSIFVFKYILFLLVFKLLLDICTNSDIFIVILVYLQYKCNVSSSS